MAKRSKVLSYFTDAFEEFGKVTWPTKEQAVLLTAVTIAISSVLALFIAAVDLGLTELYKLSI